MTKRDEREAAEWEGRFAAIEVEAAAILKAEGAHVVRGVYFVQAGDAHMSRMIEAERRVSERDKVMDKWIATPRKTGAA